MESMPLQCCALLSIAANDKVDQSLFNRKYLFALALSIAFRHHMHESRQAERHHHLKLFLFHA